MLELSESSFDALRSSIGSLKHLRYLNLSIEDKETPKFHLQVVSFANFVTHWMSNLQESPRGIGSSISLRLLTRTTKQRDLFEKEKRLKCLNSLQHLQILDCLNLEFLFKGMGSLMALRILIILDCPSLVSLSPSMRFLTSLELLIIRGCKKFEIFMDGEVEGQEDIQSFGSLQILYFINLPRLEAASSWDNF